MKTIIINTEQAVNLKKKINETPDKLYDLSGWVIASAYNDDALAFSFHNNKAYVGLNDRLFLNSDKISRKVISEFLDTTGDFKIHSSMWQFYQFLGLDFEGIKDLTRHTIDYSGRLWMDKKLISFWKYPRPNELKKILQAISKEIEKVYGNVIDLLDYKIEVDTMENFIPVSEFIGSSDASQEEIDKDHVLSPIRKKMSPQKIEYLNDRYKDYPEKFKSVSQAQWNSAKNKYMGEGIITEDPDTVSASGNKRLAGAYDNDALAFGIHRQRAFIGYNEKLLDSENSILDDYKRESVESILLDKSKVKDMKTHSGMGHFYMMLFDDDFNLPFWRSGYEYSGRVWFDKKIISFWYYPSAEKMKGVLDKIKDEVSRIYGVNIDFSDYKIEILTNKKKVRLINLKDYVTSFDFADESSFEAPHLMPPDEKKNVPQMKDYLGSRYSKYPERFNSISQAQWNSAKSKYMGESIINEVKASDVDLKSFEKKNELNPKFWNNEKLNYKVRRRLLKIADDFVEFSGIKSSHIKDIVFLGSLSNYNWSRHSDVDLHIIVDFSKVNKDVKFVKEYFEAKRKIWNSEHDSLKIYNFPIEIYVEDIDEKNSSESSFSLENNKWLKKAEPGSEITIDKDKIRKKSADIMTKIDELSDTYKSKSDISDIELISTKVKKLFDKIKLLRKDGLDSKAGEYSVGNIVFKVLRRTGYVSKIVDLKRETYDKINTLK